MFGTSTFGQLTFAENSSAGTLARIISASHGAFAFSGENMPVALSRSSSSGAFVVTGEASELLSGFVIVVGHAAFAVTGFATIIIKVAREIGQQYVRVSNYVLRRVRTIRATLKD